MSNQSSAVAVKAATEIVPAVAPRPQIVGVIDDVSPVVGEPAPAFFYPTNDPTPTFRISLQGVNAAAGDRIEVGWGGRQAGQVLTAEDLARGTALVDLPLPEGWHTVHARLVKADGSVGAWSDRGWNVGVDLDAPDAPTLTRVFDDAGASHGALSGRDRTDDARPTFTFTVDMELPPPPSQGSPGHNPFPASSTQNGYLELYADDRLVGRTRIVQSEVEITPTADLGKGKHVLTARVVDIAGNVGSESDPFTLRIQPERPHKAAAFDSEGLQAGMDELRAALERLDVRSVFGGDWLFG